MTESSKTGVQASDSGAYRSGVAVAILASFLTVWTTIVRDDGTGIGSFMVILAVGVGWFSARFRPDCMVRTMFGVAVMQVCLGALIATSPLTASSPGGAFKVLLFSGFFTALWLISAAFFRVSSKERAQPGAVGD